MAKWNPDFFGTKAIPIPKEEYQLIVDEIARLIVGWDSQLRSTKVSTDSDSESSKAVSNEEDQ